MSRRDDGWFRFTTAGRRWGLAFASARWMPEEMEPDKSKWLPIFKRRGVTISQATRRAHRAADRHFRAARTGGSGG